MPEPNLPPLKLNVTSTPVPGLVNVKELKEKIPPLPAEIREKLVSIYGLSLEHGVRLVVRIHFVL